MEKVEGIGGFFFRSHDPATMKVWYATHLGITEGPTSYNAPVWRQSGGTTIFNPFPQDTSYFEDNEKQWMMNFRVKDLMRMVGQLEAARIKVDVDPQTYPNGLFARLKDPEGNPIQLWQPM